MLFPDYSKTYANHDLKVIFFFWNVFFFIINRSTRQMMQVKRYQEFNTAILIFEILLYKNFCCQKFDLKKKNISISSCVSQFDGMNEVC